MDFGKTLAISAVGGMVAGLVGCGGSTPPADDATKASTDGATEAAPAAAAEKNCCKGMNACKGQGGCKTDANACAGKNECKAKGGCATKPKEECAAAAPAPAAQ